MSEKVAKENVKLQNWMEMNVVNDVDDNIQIAEVAQREILAKWGIDVGSPECALAVYAITYNAIMERMITERATKRSWECSIADMVTFGFDDSDDDEISEKTGNFCPFIYDRGNEAAPITEPGATTIERCTEWNSKYITTKAKTLDEIATVAVKNWSEIADIHAETTVVVWPLFTTIHEQLLKYMNIKRIDAGQDTIMMTFCSCFDIYSKKDENGNSIIEYSPLPVQKLAIKSDGTATGINE